MTEMEVNLTNSFYISKNLYGRENEIEALGEAFNNINKGQFELILVKGSSGNGKTELINRTLRPLAEKKGFFTSGKFKQFQRDEPYIPFEQAFRNLIKQILTEPEEAIEKWKKQLVNDLGKNGEIISQMIPEIELLIGNQVPIKSIDPQKSKRRFQMVIQKFMKMFMSKDHPLVLFLDDLQWADISSLNLLRDICINTKNSHLLIVCAYRDDEIKDILKFNEIIEEIKNAGVKVRNIYLTHLNFNNTQKLISDTLLSEEERVKPFSEIVYRKTLGNPFFINQLLQLVYEENYISFNKKEGIWEWNIDNIKKLGIADNVVELVIRKLKKLPKETVCILQLCSCMGNSFDLKTLSIVYKKSLVKTLVALVPLIKEGLILPRKDIEGFLQTNYYDSGDNYLAETNIEFDFLHDRIHQAAYTLITDDEKKEIHLIIGRLILENTTQNEIDDKILNIMAHINYGIDLIDNPLERIKLSKLNLLAGKRAKTSAAYDSALNYFKAGITLLNKDSWNVHYKLTYNLNIELSQCEYLSSNLEKSEELFKIILANAKTGLEKSEVNSLKMMLESSTGNYDKAIIVGIKSLKYLGVHLPQNPSKLDLIKQILLSKLIFRNKNIDDLLKLPESNNYNIVKALENLTLLAAPANFINDDLFVLIILKLAILSAKYGNTEVSAIGYSGYAIIAGSVLGDYVKGQEFEKVSLTLADKYNNNSTKCLVSFVNGTFVSHWTQHGNISVKYSKDAFEYGLESGEFLYAGYAVTTILEMKHYLGVQLDEIYEDHLFYYDFVKKMKFKTAINLMAMSKELREALKNTTECDFTFMSDAFEKEMIESEKNEIMTYYLFKIQLSYLFGDYESAYEIAKKAYKNIESIMGYIFYTEHNFYYSLAITAIFDKFTDNEKRKHLKILRKNQKQMKKWADNCEDNFLHKYLLIAAEIARLKGNNQETMTLYDKAIKSAGENGYIQNEAIANELAAKYYLSTGRAKIAEVYINDAYNKYQHWGAKGKAKSLLKQYEDIINEKHLMEKYDNLQTSNNVLCNSEDIETDYLKKEKLGQIIDALQSISEENDLDRALVKFLETVLNITGADSGYILMEEDGELFIEASKESWRHLIKTENHFNMEKYINIPKRVIRYVARTYETVILDDNMNTGIFSKDSYIMKHRPGSIVCMPLLFQDIFIGVLYLENNITTEVFTSEKVDMLRTLSNQMAYIKKLRYFIEKENDNTKPEVAVTLVDPLTTRELEVLQLIASGMSNKEIANSLGVTVSTTKTHIINIYGKLGVNRRVQAVSSARNLGLL